MQSLVAYSLNHDTHNNNIWASPYPNFPKFSSHLRRYNSVMVHPHAHPQHMKLLKHFLYIQYGCEMQSAVAHGLNYDTHNVIAAQPYPNFPNFGPHLHRYNSVRVHPYAHPQHMKVLNHCIHIQYGCGMQSVVVYSLNHTTMSFGPRLALLFQYMPIHSIKVLNLFMGPRGASLHIVKQAPHGALFQSDLAWSGK